MAHRWLHDSEHHPGYNGGVGGVATPDKHIPRCHGCEWMGCHCDAIRRKRWLRLRNRRATCSYREQQRCAQSLHQVYGYSKSARSDLTSATDIAIPTNKIRKETISKITWIGRRLPCNNIRATGMSPRAKAQKTRCHRAGSSPAFRCSVALDASV